MEAERRDYGEWFYDVTWLRFDENQRLVGCPLVLVLAESRHDDDIWDEWQKLLLSNAALKVIVFAKPDDAEVDRVFRMMASEASGYAQARVGDRLLLAGFSEEANAFRYLAHEVGPDR